MKGQRRARGYERTYLDAHFARSASGRLELAGGRLAHECETYTCLHCMTIVAKPAFMQPIGGALGYWCYTCNGTICGQTADCRNWHQNNRMTAKEFMHEIAEKHARQQQRDKWT